MKPVYQIGKFLIIGLLLAGCSSKEIFYFSKSTGNFVPYQKVPKATNLPDSLAILPELSGPEQITANSLPLTASATTEPIVWPKQKQQIKLNSGLPEKLIKIPPDRQVVKNKIKRKLGIEKLLFKPQTNKQVHEAALIGFILSLGAIIILLVGSPLAIPASLAGALFSLIGLNKMKENPDKYSGKGLAWAGIVLGFLIPLAILAFLLAYAGAF